MYTAPFSPMPWQVSIPCFRLRALPSVSTFFALDARGQQPPTSCPEPSSLSSYWYRQRRFLTTRKSFDAFIARQTLFSRHHRYETFWLNFMADELALCPETLVVAHGTAADALLRFAENREASSLLQIPPTAFQPRELHGEPGLGENARLRGSRAGGLSATSLSLLFSRLVTCLLSWCVPRLATTRPGGFCVSDKSGSWLLFLGSVHT